MRNPPLLAAVGHRRKMLQQTGKARLFDDDIHGAAPESVVAQGIILFAKKKLR